MTITVSELITRIRQRTDNEHTDGDFVTDAELIGLIRVSYQYLYGCLVRYGIHQTEKVRQILASGALDYPLPDDHLSMLAVFRLDADERTPLSRHDHTVRPSTTSVSPSCGADTYRLMNERIQFNPIPASGTYEVLYVPRAKALNDTDLDATTDTIDGVNGWEEFIVVDVSIKVLQKEKMETGDLKEERAQLLANIKDEAASRDLTESWKVRSWPRNSSSSAMDALESGNSIMVRGRVPTY
jgi:hypothetical protein